MRVMTTYKLTITPGMQDFRALRMFYAFFVFASAIWCATLFSAPILAAGDPWMRRLSGVIRLCFTPICHQASDRSFHLMGQSLAVCARCTGIYCGFLAGVLIYPLRLGTRSPELLSRKMLVIAGLPTALEITGSRLGVIPDSSVLRALTGGLLGVVVAFCVLQTVHDLFPKYPNR